MPNRDIEADPYRERREFSKEDFSKMINDTYHEFYGKFRDQFNPEEFMQCVEDEEMIERFGHFLEESDENLLTMRTMPYLDLGNVPTTHSFMRSEGQQVFYVPNNRNPDLVYVKYSAILPKYHSRNPKKRFDESSLPLREVTFRDFEKTINLCTAIVKSYRGKILKYE